MCVLKIEKGAKEISDYSNYSESMGTRVWIPRAINAGQACGFPVIPGPEGKKGSPEHAA